jgi:acyl carrier protein
MSSAEKVIKIVARICKVDPATISRQTEYVRDLGIQKSVAYIQMITLLESEFDLELDFSKISNAGTVGTTVDYIDSLLA